MNHQGVEVLRGLQVIAAACGSEQEYQARAYALVGFLYVNGLAGVLSREEWHVAVTQPLWAFEILAEEGEALR